MAETSVGEPSPPTAGQQEPAAAGGRMPFLAHLDELRRRLFRSALAILAGFLVCWYFSTPILNFLLKPVTDSMGTLSVIRPAEGFLNKMKAALLAGIFVAFPFVFYQFWAFVAPGLYPRERRWVAPIVAFGTALFVAGAAFSYWVAVPSAATFLASQAEGFEQHVTVDSAFGFASKLLLGLGAVFELPLIMFALAKFGAVTPRFLLRKLDVAVFICFAVAALITPTPDVMTMTIFALPMIGLYLLGIAVAFVAAPRSAK
ncbi:MAG: twin-arginine translocase subunit TatC [Acidobacteria bacterium]|nr:twin-arginine translocase subunit TatC [Acidobacteriota bacterium]